MSGMSSPLSLSFLPSQGAFWAILWASVGPAVGGVRGLLGKGCGRIHVRGSGRRMRHQNVCALGGWLTGGWVGGWES